MLQREALTETVEASDADVPAALLSVALGLADAVDADPKNAALWREYRAALADVMEVVNGSPDDAVAAFRIAIETPRVRSSVRHSEDTE